MGLTDRERSVLSYLLKGYTVREAAKELGISHVMVVKYKKGIVGKWRKKKRLPNV
jgi:DNA-binding NarL/FixJ family response regulator